MKRQVWWLFFLMFACEPAQKDPVSDSLSSSKPDFGHQPQRINSPPDQVFNAGWRFAKGRDERLTPTHLPEPDSPVVLPHRVLLPNTALWYKQTISIPEPGALFVQADDGAQVWVNDKPAPRIQGDMFAVPAAENAAVLIRVLNNAMAGGLSNVSYFTQGRVDLMNQEFERQVAAKRMQEKKQQPLKTGGALVIGPWLTRTDSFFTVRLWGDSIPVKLEWGLAPEKLTYTEQQVGSLVAFQVYAPAGNWYYRICAAGKCSVVYKVSADRDVFSFSVWGDSQSGWPNFYEHISHLKAAEEAFTVGVGDLVGEGCEEEEWRTFSGILSDYAANRPAYLVAGNHDYDGYYSSLNPHLYLRYASPAGSPYFAWAYANCAFIAIDPNNQFPIGFSDAQTTWFQKQISSEAWKNATWRFVFLHQPPFSQGWAGYEGDSVVRDFLEPLLESAQIDFVIAGHTHDYERLVKRYGKQQTHFIITGGGGGSLEPPLSSTQPAMDTVIKSHHYLQFQIAGKELTWRVRNLRNDIIDTYRVTK